MIDLDDLREFLANTGFYATERELQGILVKCDKNNNGLINFAEFVDEFSPKLGMWTRIQKLKVDEKKYEYERLKSDFNTFFSKL